MSSKQPPNLLVIMSDEHAPMYSGPYGHPLVQTPHMDRLAEDGVTFIRISSSWACWYSLGDPPELYDIAEDPNEFQNLADNDAYQAICREFEAQLLADWDPIEIEKQVRESQKARILIDQVTEGQWRKPPNS